MRQSQPDHITTLHQRASDWYERHGYYEEAMNHLLLAQDFMQAARLIEQSNQEMMKRWEFALNTMNHAVAQGRLRPAIDRVFPFEDAKAAYRYYEEAQPFGKVIISH